MAETFLGYDTLDGPATPILALLDPSLALVDTLPVGADGFVVLGQTPFYLEAGGQVSDTGTLLGPAGSATPVVDVVRLGAGAAARPPRAAPRPRR